jgi:TonB family protein
VFDPNQTCGASTTLQNDLGQDEDADPNMLAPGKTVLQFLIAADGHVEKTIIARSSGHGDLDTDAQQALGQCTFKPAIGADGKPQEAWTSMGYVWQLN